jgi:hypothetical protein
MDEKERPNRDERLRIFLIVGGLLVIGAISTAFVLGVWAEVSLSGWVMVLLFCLFVWLWPLSALLGFIYDRMNVGKDGK